jgi:hypothetical protein
LHLTGQDERHKAAFSAIPFPTSKASIMADNPEAQPQMVSVSDVPHAPFVYFENVPAFGFVNGIAAVTLSANRTWVGPDGKVVNDQVVVAYLRGNVPAFLGLRQAIDSALLMAAPTQQEAN